MGDGWNESAAAWIADMGDHGDFGRRFVLDAPMLERVRRQPFGNALDVGCGEGRFCRMLAQRGIAAVGIDPTAMLIAQARMRDPVSDYRIGRAERLAFPDGSFDLVVSYLTFIDIPDIAAGIAEMARVLRPGGTLLVANLNNFATAGRWSVDAGGRERYSIDHYFDERSERVAWRGISIDNWHRPLGTYMALLIDAGLELRHFAEPAPSGGDPAKQARYRRAPWFCIMEWQKPLQ